MGYGVMRRKRQLTVREWKSPWEFTRTGSNASQAARVAYERTPISVRVKGHEKKIKLKAFLDKIDKMWGQFLVRKPDGHLSLGKETDQIEREVDACLRRLKRRTVKNET